MVHLETYWSIPFQTYLLYTDNRPGIVTESMLGELVGVGSNDDVGSLAGREEWNESMLINNYTYVSTLFLHYLIAHWVIWVSLKYYYADANTSNWEFPHRW